MGKKEPKYGVNCSGCVHVGSPDWCGRCRITISGRPSCYLHCSKANGHIMQIKEFCGKCKNDEKCRCDAEFRDECIYNGTGVPSEFKPEGVRESMEQSGGEKYRNYCECCAHTDTEKCDGCETAYDGIPTGYLFELAQKTQADIRAEILEQAKICVCTDRNQQYGEPEDSFAMIGDMWGRYIAEKCLEVYKDEEGTPCSHIEILPEDVALLMVLFKVCRGATGEKITKDTLVDIAGYAACAGGMIDV